LRQTTRGACRVDGNWDGGAPVANEKWAVEGHCVVNFFFMVVLLKNSTRNELLCGYLMIFVVWSFGA
jgi:hypothetical protein